jgi:hypothetical protein
MGLFANNINPEPPKDRSWNNVTYEILLEVLNRDYMKRHNPSNMWFTSQEDAESYSAMIQNNIPYPSKNYFEKRMSNFRRVPKDIVEAINTTTKEVFEKYGVWVKCRIQVGQNGRIKSIYFTKIC